MKKTAFFLNGEYYLVPEEYKSFSEFYSYIKSRKNTKLKASRLNEIKCMVPYFDSGEITEIQISISGDDEIFEAQVELLTASEYHDRLAKVVQGYCAGCLHFIDDGNYDELNGHHEEISLDSTCLLRKENSYETFYELADGMDDLASKFNEKKADLEKLVLEGKTDAAKDEVIKLFGEFMPKPIDVYFEKSKNKIACFFPNFIEDAYMLVNFYVCRFLNDAKIDGWEFYNYLPKGKIKTNKKFLPPQIFEEELEVSGVSQKIFCFKLADNSFLTFKEAYLDICNDIGEDKFLAYTFGAGLSFGLETAGHEIKFSEFKKAATKFKTDGDFFGDGTLVPPAKNIVSYSSEGVPSKVATYCSPLFFTVFDGVEKAFAKNESNPWNDIFCDIGFSVLRLNLKIENALYNKSVLSKTFSGLKNLLNSKLAFCFAREISGNEFNIYFITANYAKFLYELRKHSPVFEGLFPTATLATPAEFKKYEVDFKFNLLEKKKI